MKTVLCFAAFLLPALHAQADDLLGKIRAAHSLSCAVVKEEEDYSRATDHGNRAAFDIDLCKAVAVAALGPGTAFTVKPYPDEPAAVDALKKGEVALIASASPTVRNQVVNGLAFTQPTFYDGQGFLTPVNPGVRTARDLAGKKICYLTGSAADEGLRAFAAREHIEYIWYPFSEAGEMEAAFFTGNCAAITSDVSQLANIRGIDKEHASRFTILPDRIREDPLAPAFPQGEPRFGALVGATVNALAAAERWGVTQANAAKMQTSGNEDAQELFRGWAQTGRLLGLDGHWGANVMAAVGNYGELWERDLGAGSPLRLPRGENRLWVNGGLLYALPPGD